jgi:hypothetical protein
MIAQKFLHDNVYNLTTWSDNVCNDRDDLHNDNLHTTERLILDHISWRVFAIADEEQINKEITNCHNEGEAAFSRYCKYLPPPTSDAEDSWTSDSEDDSIFDFEDDLTSNSEYDLSFNFVEIFSQRYTED